jgi:hypothetical protein
MYQFLKNTYRGAAQSIRRCEDGACIPFDPANTDYQAYLKWLEEGNAPIGADKPLPADEPNEERQG